LDYIFKRLTGTRAILLQSAWWCCDDGAQRRECVEMLLF